MAYAIWTVTDMGEGKPLAMSGRVATTRTWREAARRAKELAGPGARFVRRGVDRGYATAAVTAWIEAVAS